MLAENAGFAVIARFYTMHSTIQRSELCSTLEVTPATIRRDPAALEDEGCARPLHGGAGVLECRAQVSASYETLARSNSDEKDAIAREAEKLILDGDTVFLEGSTTVLELAARLHNRNRLTW